MSQYPLVSAVVYRSFHASSATAGGGGGSILLIILVSKVSLHVHCERAAPSLPPGRRRMSVPTLTE
jgi:hypothetical protein